MKTRTAWITLTALCFLLLVAPSVVAFEEENQPDPPPEGCLGSNDPACGGGGDGGGSSLGCYMCEYIPEGPDGQPSYHTCAMTGTLLNPGYATCRAYANNCLVSNQCFHV